MLKRLIALIGALVMVFALALPCFAAQSDYDTSVTLSSVVCYPEYSYLTLIDISSTVKFSCVATDGSAYSFTVSNFRLTSSELGSLYGAEFSGLEYTTVFYLLDDYIRCRVSSSFVVDCVSVTISYNLSGVTSYHADFCDLYGFIYPVSFVREDLDIARQEGYDEGFTAGQGSIDQDAIRQEGYAEGFTAGQTSTDAYQNGYDEGFTTGQGSIDQDAIRQEGYDEGYQQGTKDYADLYQSATLNIFRSCQLELIVNYYGNGLSSSPTKMYTLEDVPLVINSNNVVSFSGIGDYVLNRLQVEDSSITLDKIRISTASFSWPLESDNVGAFNFTKADMIYYAFEGNSAFSVRSPYIYGYLDGVSVSYVGSLYGYTYDRYIMFSDIPSGFTVSALVLNFDSDTGSASVFESFRLSSDVYMVSQVYREGYVNGYYDGENAEYSEVKQASYQEGYDVGFSVGKKEGLSISETGDWKNLMLAVVEAPINTFQSLFNFEILGLDMRLAFGSILAVCVLLIIVKKVVL